MTNSLKEHVINCVKKIVGIPPQPTSDQVTEDRYMTGCVIAMDCKDGIDISTEDAGIVQIGSPTPNATMKLLEVFLEQSVFEDGETTEEIAEYFIEHINDVMYFRFKNSENLENLDDVLKTVRTFSFWSPVYVMVNGVWHDTFGVTTEDEYGNTLGIRL